MKLPKAYRRDSALTLLEVLVVIFVLAILFSMVDFGAGSNAKLKAQKIQCVSNLKGIGIAYRITLMGQRSDYLTWVSVTNGGVMESVQSGNAYVIYQAMSNELSNTKVLVCAADQDHFAAASFSSLGNTNVSYFAGLDAKNDSRPELILSGDANLALGKKTVKSGLFALRSNSPAVWTTTRHGRSGNLLLADGSVQSLTPLGLTNQIYLTGLATNRLAIP
jgi:prepilin-type N-terminal cleavage/methylation domain-containing protein/prepilin-type processing-associated H-X9-DG protein